MLVLQCEDQIINFKKKSRSQMDVNKLLKYSCFLGAISKAWFLACFFCFGVQEEGKVQVNAALCDW